MLLVFLMTRFKDKSIRFYVGNKEIDIVIIKTEMKIILTYLLTGIRGHVYVEVREGFLNFVLNLRTQIEYSLT